MRRIWLITLVGGSLLCGTMKVYAWGDEGHEIVGLIADHYLTAGMRNKVNALLAQDASGLTAVDIASEATSADKYRDEDRNTTKVHYLATREWHFVDIEIGGPPDIDTACFGHPAPTVRHTCVEWVASRLRSR